MSRQLRRSNGVKRGGSSSLQVLVTSVTGRVRNVLNSKPWLPYVAVGIFVLFIALWPMTHGTRGREPQREPDGEDMQVLAPIRAGGVRTQRVGCRDYDSGGQSCAYSGVACVDLTDKGSRPVLYFVDDGRPDFAPISTDNWCEYEPSGDPRRAEWPPRRVFAPRHSCVEGYWRTMSSLFEGWFTQPVVRWVGDIAWLRIGHRLLHDISWLLDVALWQEALDASGTVAEGVPQLFDSPKHLFLLQSEEEFERRTAGDVDRLIFAITFRLNTSKLYRNVSDDSSATRPLLTAYPSLRDRLLFYGEERRNSSVDLMCTRKIAIGASLNELGGERVCHTMRSEAWKLYGIDAPKLVQVGNYRYHRPPSRVVFLRDRFGRIAELVAALRSAAAHHRFELEITTVSSMITARQQVETFAGAGVLIMAHGVHRTGALWMPRHSSIVEVFPPGYTDFNVRSLSKACNLWYHELHSKLPQERHEEYVEMCMNRAQLRGPEQCTYMKRYDIEVEVDETMRMVMLAYSKLGHNSG